MSIYQAAVRKPVTTALIYVGLAVIGIFSFSRLSVDFLPSISDNTIYMGNNRTTRVFRRAVFDTCSNDWRIRY